jgi:hypothetical protein
MARGRPRSDCRIGQRGLRPGEPMVDIASGVAAGTNRLLDSLPAAQRQRLTRTLRPVFLGSKTVLFLQRSSLRALGFLHSRPPRLSAGGVAMPRITRTTTTSSGTNTATASPLLVAMSSSITKDHLS